MLIKWQIFALTFLSYMTLHSMRMSYAQVKPQFQSAFHITHLQLGIFDASIYLALALGYFLRYKFQTKKNLIRTYFLYMNIACLAFVYIPITSLLLGEKTRNNVMTQQILPSLSLLVFGFCQFPSWPTLLTIINQHFDVQKEGGITGTWSACGDIGNILGLVLSGIMITSLHLKWQYLMLTVAVLNWLSSLLIYFFIDQNSYRQSSPGEGEPQQSASNQGETSQFSEFWAFVKQIMKKQENNLYLLEMALLKSILYAFLLWIPTYLTANNHAYYKSTVPIFFNIGALIGSFFLGYFYKNLHSKQADHLSGIFNHLKSYSLFYSCFAATAVFSIFYLCKITIAVFFILSLISGAFLGGCFNMHASNEAIAVVKGDKENVSKLSTLSMAIGNLFVGLVEFLIGVVLDVKASSKGQKMLFMILVSIGVICMLALLRRSYLLSNSRSTQQYQTLE